MTYMAKLQDALQETVVAIDDVIRVHASEMRKIHDAREYSWDVQHAAAADLAQDLNHNIRLQTKELQKLDEAREGATTSGQQRQSNWQTPALSKSSRKRSACWSGSGARSAQKLPMRPLRTPGRMSCMMMDPLRKPGKMSCTTGCISPLRLQLRWTRPSRSSWRTNRQT